MNDDTIVFMFERLIYHPMVLAIYLRSVRYDPTIIGSFVRGGSHA